MREDSFDDKVLGRYQSMVSQGENWYFDVDQFCDILNHFIDIHDLGTAKEALDIAFYQHPQSNQLRVKKLELLLAEGDISKARDLIFSLFEQEIHNGDFLICLGKYHSQKSQHEKAIIHFKKALKCSEEHAYILNAMATEYMCLDLKAKALHCFKESLKIQPEDDFALRSIVNCFEDLDRQEKCIEFLLEYIDREPYSEMAWYNLGLQYISAEEFEKALEAFDYAHLINPESSNSLFQKANCHEILEDFSTALNVYKELSECEEHEPFAIFKMGECYFEMKDYSLALQYYLKSTYQDPQQDKAWFAQSLTYEKMENLHEARYSIERAIDLDSENIDYLRQYAYLNIELNFFEEAAQGYLKITEMEPDNFHAWFVHSELLITVGDFEKAVDALKKSFKYIPKNAKLYYQLSYCYFLMNDKKNGGKYLSQALTINPKIIEEMEKKYPHFSERNRLMVKN